ncbi:MAG TPA: EAL domain-containing protein, partial [Methylophaga aminisulfidivorans]|nr:EAL domain-containing protein [Methylophaga aminisulfidivorans]
NTLLSDVYPDIHFLYTETPKQALEKVSRGEADAYIGDAAFANYQIKHHDLLNLQFSGQTKAQSAYRMGISKHQPELFNIVNKVFQKISEDERKDIVEQWIGIEVNNGLSTKTIIKLVASALLIATFLGYWILYLRKSRRAVMSSEKKLNDVLNTSPVPMAIVSGEDTATYINEAFTKVFGFELAEVHGLNDWLLKVLPNATKRQRFIEQIAHALEQQTDTSSPPSSFEAAMLCKDGKYRTIICNAKKLDTHATAETLLIFYDISERKRAEEKLKLSGRVFNQAHEGILITDGSGMLVDVNPAFSEITGYSREQALYQNPSILKSDRHEPDFYSEMWTALRVEGHWQGEIWNRRQNGDTYAQLLTISTLDDENGETTHYLGLFSDITESKQQQQALEMMAHYDVLTQLPNRTLFADRFKQAIAHSHRNNTLLAVVFLDLDGFKPVNDQYGHDVGDQLLIEVSKRISTCVREDDTVSRLGGDEFAMLLNDISSSEHCENLINRIRHAIELPYEINGESILISASLGVTLYPEDNSDADTLLRHADQAMYKAKQSGRQRHQLFDTQEDQQYNEKQSQFKSIQDALKADELVLFYQPKLNMRTGQVIGAEALIRWQHPEQGLLMPRQFLPTIENSDLEIELGNWVINQVIKQVSIWKNQGIELEVSINISSHHILWPGFYEYLELILSRYENTSPQLIQLEILESSVLTDIQNISSIISQCRQSLGLKISLDDFGTGYSSLTHLRHFPVDIIKIDRSFIRDIIDDSYDYTIVDGVIGLTDAFHHQVIAEGVETTQQGLMLLAMGCELAQGYAIAKPMSVTDFHEWLGTYQADSDWLDFASQHMSAEQTLAELMTLQITHWHARVINNLRSTPDSIQQWPSMDLKKCHFEHWLQQAKKQNLFDNEWLQSMNIAYTELYHEANALKYQFQQQQLENNEVGISELTKRYETIIDLLANRD